MTHTEIAAIAKKILTDRENMGASWSVGVRSLNDDEQYNVGDYARNSYKWDFENDESTYDLEDVETEEYNYTSTTGIEPADSIYGDANDDDDVEALASAIEDAIKFNKIYPGQNIAILVGDAADDFEDDVDHDEREASIVSPIVYGVFNK